MAKVTKKKASSAVSEPLQLRTSPIAPEPPKNRKTRSPKVKKSYLAIFALVLLLGAGGLLGYRVYDNQRKEISRLSNPQESAKAETERIKEEVSRLIELPADEDPTVATVVDSTKLSNQPFFAKAKDGDRVVMYAKAKKAVLYRPSTKKLIEVAPINLGDPKTPAQSTPSTTAPQSGSSEDTGISNTP